MACDDRTLGEILAVALSRGRTHPHPTRGLMSDYRLADDYSLQAVALAHRFCAEMEARTELSAEDVWTAIQESPALERDLFTIEGWATLSAFVTGGGYVLRLPMSSKEN